MHQIQVHGPDASTIDPSRPSPRLPNELLALIIELVFLTSSPTPAPAPEGHPSDTTIPGQPRTPSTWQARTNLLLVNKAFLRLATPHLYRTISLDTDRSLDAYFRHVLNHEHGSQLFAGLDRAWFGNVSAAQRNGLTIDPVQYRLAEAAWYEETAGGFIIGHAYASRRRMPRGKAKSKRGPKRLRRVSVYWAEEEIIEEVSDPESGSASEGEGEGAGEDEGTIAPREGLHSDGFAAEGSGTSASSAMAQPARPAWQTLYASNRQTRAARDNGHRPEFQGPRRRVAMSATLSGPVEGELDPWDMVEAQERLTSQQAALDPATGSASTAADPPDLGSLSIAAATPSPPLPDPPDPPAASTSHKTTLAALVEHRHAHRRQLHLLQEPREIVAYHLVTATLENWINRMFTEIRTLRYITLTFYPGIILDDDKLEHVLRRMLSADENPKLELLLVRIAHEPVAAGSRFRRLDRAMTIGGAVDRIQDDRIRVEGLGTAVGGEILSPPRSQASARADASDVPQPSDSSRRSEKQPESKRTTSAAAKDQPVGSASDSDSIDRLNDASRRAVHITQDGWWSRVLQQNHARRGDATEPTAHSSISEEGDTQPFSSLFGRGASCTTIERVLGQADPFVDAPPPIGRGRSSAAGKASKATARLLEDGTDIEPRTGYRQLQLNYINGWARRDTEGGNEAFEG
ncbi:uncharacterized protein PSFLO_06275 [Pseudozyma flocculosa]|uniref:Uncharacterized protein n=2 Tax=Pseudozyma flocculosa TaxID=84751 RepID=A0A5C3F8K1_9BASI|nr:uncharacterized protein PSFLO_06275 [Pseudozyma flocculosa]